MTLIGTCAIAVAGCGGGGDDGATTAGGPAANLPTVTSPPVSAAAAPSEGSEDGSATTTAPSETPFLGPSAERTRQQLAPFVDCLSRHGVDADQFRHYEPRNG